MHLAIKSLLAGLILCISHALAQSGWSPWNFPTGASTPPGQTPTFTPIEVFPRPGDPGYNLSPVPKSFRVLGRKGPAIVAASRLLAEPGDGASDDDARAERRRTKRAGPCTRTDAE